MSRTLIAPQHIDSKLPSERARMIGVQRKKTSANLAKNKLNGASQFGACTLNKMLSCPSITNLNGFKGLKEKSRYHLVEKNCRFYLLFIERKMRSRPIISCDNLMAHKLWAVMGCL